MNPDAKAELRAAADQSFNQLLQGDAISRIVVVVGGLLMVLPAIDFVTGMLGLMSGRTLPVLAAISMVGPLLVGCLYFPVRRYWYLGIVPGIATGPLALAAIAMLAMAFERLSTILIIVGIVVGCLPGFVIWFASMQWKYRRDTMAAGALPDRR